MQRKIWVVYLLLISNISFCYTSYTSFVDSYANWTSGTGSVNTSDGLEIKYSKRIDSKTQTPIALPDFSAMGPSITPYGVDWEMNLSLNGASSTVIKYMDKLTDFFGPDTLEILALVGGQYALNQMNPSLAKTLDDYVRIAQSADQFTTTLYNHRYQILNSINNGSGDSVHVRDSFSKGSEEFFRGMEREVMSNYIQKRSQFDSYDEPAVKLISYLNNNDKRNFQCGNISDIDDKRIITLNSLIDVYSAILVKGKKPAVKGVFSTVYDIRSRFRNYALYKLGKSAQSNDAERFSSDPGVKKILESYGITSQLQAAKNSRDDQKSRVIDNTEYVFLKVMMGEKLDYTIALLDNFSPYINNNEVRAAYKAVREDLLKTKMNFINRTGDRYEN